MIALKVLRNSMDLPHLFLPKEQKGSLMESTLIREISKNTIPIRPDRQNPRKFKHYKDRYPMNARRGL